MSSDRHRGRGHAVTSDATRTSTPSHLAFQTDGFAILPRLITDAECQALSNLVDALPTASAGTRRLLTDSVCRDLAIAIRDRAPLRSLLGSDRTAVQCTYLTKSVDTNWHVAFHQDLSIPVRAPVNDVACTGWSVKEGQHYVQPPIEVLEHCLAVRVHLDDNDSVNGPLRIVPGSHLAGRLSPQQMEAHRRRAGAVECTVKRGDGLVMRPLVLHASSKTRSAERRRVLQYVFGPADLPCGLHWAQAV